MDAFADGNAECCLTHTLAPELSAILKSETLKCDPLQLGKLMADHAQLDWVIAQRLSNSHDPRPL